MALTLYLCPKCDTSLASDGKVDVTPLLKAHAKICGETPRRVARMKKKGEAAPPLETQEFVNGVVDRFSKAAADAMAEGFKNVVKNYTKGKRR